MKKKLPFILSLGALALVACKREPKLPVQGEASSPHAPTELPASSTGDGRIHSTDAPTVSELAAADPRTARVLEKVRTIVAKQLGAAPEKVVPDAELSKDLGADNLKTMSLIMAFEEEFNLSITDEDAAKIKTVGDAVNTLISLGAR